MVKFGTEAPSLVQIHAAYLDVQRKVHQVQTENVEGNFRADLAALALTELGRRFETELQLGTFHQKNDNTSNVMIHKSTGGPLQNVQLKLCGCDRPD